jgi:drug/metabolite transporter (DMT)-like permease
MRTNLVFILQALLAALFFGASAPLSKLLLEDVPPVLMAALLYLGSGTGITLVKLSQRMTSHQKEAGIRRPDVKWLAGAILAGGILAPILLMVSLQYTPASTASLLLNFEGVATTTIALFLFHESVSRRAIAAILIITLASIFLSTDFSNGFGLSLGALGILLACTLWGLDNNFTRNISAKDPLTIVAWKGLVAGTFSLILGLLLGSATSCHEFNSENPAAWLHQLWTQHHAFHLFHARPGRFAHQRIIWNGSARRCISLDSYLSRSNYILFCACCNPHGRRRLPAGERGACSFSHPHAGGTRAPSQP